MNSKDAKQTVIEQWVRDIVSIESAVEEMMDQQLKLDISDANLSSAIRSFHDTTRDSKHRLEAFAEAYSDDAKPSAVRKAGGEILAKVGSFFERMRTGTVLNAVQDDVVGFTTLYSAYTSLYTTAKTLNNTEVEQFAAQGMDTYADLVMEANNQLPAAVMYDLSHEQGVAVVDPVMVEAVRERVAEAWVRQRS